MEFKYVPGRQNKLVERVEEGGRRSRRRHPGGSTSQISRGKQKCNGRSSVKPTWHAHPGTLIPDRMGGEGCMAGGRGFPGQAG